MHNGMIQFTGEKMAKSVGNIALLHEVIEQYGPQAVVMYLISGHYRQPLAFSDAALVQARANVERIREAGRRLGPGPTTFPDSDPGEPGNTDPIGQGATDPAEPGEADPTGSGTPTKVDDLDSLRTAFLDALANDFNTPSALANLNEWLRAAAQLGATGDEDLREMLQIIGLESLLSPAEEAPAEVRELAEQREQARAGRDFAAADELRNRIAALGWEVRDSSQGFELLPLSP
jgi:cysteinyl-tRNA synthetase